MLRKLWVLVFVMDPGTALVVASIVGAASAIGGTVLSATQKAPRINAPPAPVLAPPPRDREAPPAANTGQVERTEQEGRRRAVQRQQQLARRRQGANTVLTSPLGVSQAPSGGQTTVLGR